jgi:nucleoside-diphosphate kinase
MPANAERSFIMIKPDGVQRNLIGKIVGRFEERGYKIVAMKMVHATTEHLEKRMFSESDWINGRSLILPLYP